MLRLLRFFIGLLLLPLCVAVTIALLDTLRSIPNTGLLLSSETYVLLAGYFLWIGMWFFMPQPIRVYVTAHELTHAVWGLLFGARVSNLKVSARGGSVRLSKSNLFITLAPYFFPFYTVLVVLVRLLASLVFDPVPVPLFWLFLVGLTWSFHVTFTLHSLMTIRQPDVQEYGQIFSYTVIYLLNLVGVGIWVVCTTSATLETLTAALMSHSQEIYRTIIAFIILYSSKLYHKLLLLLKTVRIASLNSIET